MEQRKRFYIALAAYAVLGLLIWMTIGNIPLPIHKIEIGRDIQFTVHITLRQLALVILAMFAVRTVLYQRLVN